MRRLLPSASWILAVIGLTLASSCLSTTTTISNRAPVVYITDFGLRDGAVSAMKGVALGVDAELVLEDLTHGIKPFDIWEASYRLYQSAEYWPDGTVFVCVIDPGVGTERRSIVARTQNDFYFVTPDNGTLTLVQEQLDFVEVREISAAHRLPGSEQSATFHGRDVYSLTGALLASGQLKFEDVGPVVDPASLVCIEYERGGILVSWGSSVNESGVLEEWTGIGMVPVLDPNFGNVWTNLLAVDPELQGAKGKVLRVTISKSDEQIYSGEIPWVNSFGEVPVGNPLLYANSLGNFAIALNQGNFAMTHGISAGPEWSIILDFAP